MHNDQPKQKLAFAKWSQIQLGFHTFVLTIAIFTGLCDLPFIITIPRFNVNWFSYFLGLIQHCLVMGLYGV